MKFLKNTLLVFIVLFFASSAVLFFVALPKYRIKSVILFIGDGMGFNHIEAAKIASKKKTLNMEFGVFGKVSTKSFDSEVTDSAAAATAMACGIKTNNGTIGRFNGQDFANISEYAKSAGKSVGILSTDYLDGATPAAFSAHVDWRDESASILSQQSESNIDILMGANERGNMSIKEMTERALGTLSQNDNGFFLMVEAGHIDKYSHANELNGAIDELLEFDEAIGFAKSWAKNHKDTAIIVTADHETGGLEINHKTPHYTSGGHTAQNVPLFLFRISLPNNSIIDNTEIFTMCYKSLGISPWKGKKLLTYGDSLTAFGGWQDQVKNVMELKSYVNLGHNGSSVATPPPILIIFLRHFASRIEYIK